MNLFLGKNTLMPKTQLAEIFSFKDSGIQELKSTLTSTKGVPKKFVNKWWEVKSLYPNEEAKVALLNIGSESIKGNETIKNTWYNSQYSI